MAKKRVALVDDFQSILNSGDFEVFKNVFKKCDIEYKGNYNETPIFKQVVPNEDNFDLFVELGADIFARTI